MKGFFRNDAVQAVLGFLLGVYFRVVLHTVRWTHENVACVEPTLTGDNGAIALFWHGRVPLCLPLWFSI